jgi:hypothetical protein
MTKKTGLNIRFFIARNKTIYIKTLQANDYLK